MSESQLRLARDGVAIGKQRHQPENTILAELAAQATESGFRNLANSTVPDSLNFPHDGVGADHDSVGPHQMRAGIWGSVGMAELMRPQYQINWFYDQADKLGPAGSALAPADLAQAVEQSAPDAYAHSLDLARQFYTLFAGIDVSSMTPGFGECGSSGAGPLNAAPPGAFGAAVVAAAGRWIGTPYVWGGGDTDGPTRGGGGGAGFDCSGLTLYAIFQASGGHIALPHYTQAQQDDPRATVISFDQRRPGDLIYFTKPGEHESHHVGILAGNSNGIDLVLNSPTTGRNTRIEPLADWNGEHLDIRRFG
ncbi:C40 family peptidase [Nocardia terpenica]|nr:C40 family peptidase [Nocardia terpenica]MBF6107208.1 C40 family peptidase [Nocardia terpenica]MBF6114966.1 C40 family peptidase [Nocardia terpenica]MBF6122071.1 C40 family peptidase [Nocardia terpenica]MBF6154454.1 C40 family peptidase [Nocardia terpenica]